MGYANIKERPVLRPNQREPTSRELRKREETIIRKRARVGDAVHGRQAHQKKLRCPRGLEYRKLGGEGE